MVSHYLHDGSRYSQSSNAMDLKAKNLVNSRSAVKSVAVVRQIANVKAMVVWAFSGSTKSGATPAGGAKAGTSSSGNPCPTLISASTRRQDLAF